MTCAYGRKFTVCAGVPQHGVTGTCPPVGSTASGTTASRSTSPSGAAAVHAVSAKTMMGKSARTDVLSMVRGLVCGEHRLCLAARTYAGHDLVSVASFDLLTEGSRS